MFVNLNLAKMCIKQLKIGLKSKPSLQTLKSNKIRENKEY